VARNERKKRSPSTRRIDARRGRTAGAGDDEPASSTVKRNGRLPTRNSAPVSVKTSAAPMAETAKRSTMRRMTNAPTRRAALWVRVMMPMARTVMRSEKIFTV
jgi:hypothetical protein